MPQSFGAVIYGTLVRSPIQGPPMVLALYFAPTLLAILRHHHNSWSIAGINFLLGWTVISWVFALAMAGGQSQRPSPKIIVGHRLLLPAEAAIGDSNFWQGLTHSLGIEIGDCCSGRFSGHSSRQPSGTARVVR
jgi:Superinfection immunity protein